MLLFEILFSEHSNFSSLYIFRIKFNLCNTSNAEIEIENLSQRHSIGFQVGNSLYAFRRGHIYLRKIQERDKSRTEP